MSFQRNAPLAMLPTGWQHRPTPRGSLSPARPSWSPYRVTALTSAFMVEELTEAQKEGEAKKRKIQSSLTKAISFYFVGLSAAVKLCWILIVRKFPKIEQ